MLEQIIRDIIDDLTHYFLSFNSLINLSSINKHFYNNVHVINLLDIRDKYLRNLTDSILKQSKYLNVRYFNADNNLLLTSVNHLTKLEVLYVDNCCGIGDDGFKNINLRLLGANGNSKITIVNHMTKLKTLYAMNN